MALAYAEGRLLHWGACLQDRDKCATCSSPKCACAGASGLLWRFQACQEKMCMRCFQMDDGATVTQVGKVLADACPSQPEAAALACQDATIEYRSIYSFGTRCIDLGTGTSLNCIQAARDYAGAVENGGTTEPQLFLGELSLTAFIAIMVVGGSFFVAFLVGGSILIYRYHKRKPMLDAVHKSELYPLSPPKKAAGSSSKNTSPNGPGTTSATPRKNRSVLQSQILEQAVDDLV